jgi:hypothetical protein
MQIAIILRRTALGSLGQALAALVLLTAPLPVFAQQAATGPSARPVDAFTGLPLPVLEGEQMVRLKDGCNQIVDTALTAEQRNAMSQWRWYGACKAGLADGPGYLRLEAPNATGEAAKFWPQSLRFGRSIRKPAPPPEKMDYVFYHRGPLHDAEWYFRIKGSPAAAVEEDRKLGPGLGNVLDRTGEPASLILAHADRKDDAQAVTEMLWVRKVPCPSVAGYGITIAGTLAESKLLNAQQQKLLLPYCEKAYAALKAQFSDSYPGFDRVNYGYYFLVLVSREVWSAGVGGAPPTSMTDNKDVTICPVLLDVNSCEPIWRPMLARVIAMRDAEQKNEDSQRELENARIASLEAEHERLIVPLDAAWRRKMAELARDYVSRAQPAQPVRKRSSKK